MKPLISDFLVFSTYKGRPLLTAPRTDPYVRNYRIRLLPWILTSRVALGSSRPDPVESLLVRQTVHAIGNPGSVSGPISTVCRSPRSVSFPPQTPQQFEVPLCSPASQVLRDCLTSQRRACRDYGIAPSPTDPSPMRGMSLGSPSFREESFRPCVWSSTPWG